MNAFDIASLELLAVDLPLRRPFKHAAAERSRSESVFLKCVTDSGAVGFGECLPRKYVTGETRDGAFDCCATRSCPGSSGRSFGSLAEVEEFLARCDGRAPLGWVDPRVPHERRLVRRGPRAARRLRAGLRRRPLDEGARGLPPGFRYSGVLSADGGRAARPRCR